MVNTTDILYKLVSKIPIGKISTYKDMGILSGIKNPRLVGKILHKNPDPEKIPCHRVLKSDGSLAEGYAFGGKIKQKKKLEKEGVKFIKNKVNLEVYKYRPGVYSKI